MYEVLDVPRMMRIKSPHVRNRKNLPTQIRRGPNRIHWGGMILIREGTSMQQLRLIPDGSEIKLCIQDKSVWEVYIPKEYKKSLKLLAKRLDAIAFM